MDQQPAMQEPLRYPERVGRYEVLLPIASGGMATVYLARAVGPRGFEREVALKLVHPHLRDDERLAADLIEEAKLSVRIRHPNVVPVLDAGDDPAGVYLAMDYVEGESLSGLVRAAAAAGIDLPASIAMRVLLDGLAGLHAAHELGDAAGRSLELVHRDFSPQNLLVGTDGHSRLADFGVARAATRIAQTQTGVVKGKIGYMAPEQVRGRPLDRRCDVWAAGVLAWELLAGRRLHPSSDVSTMFEIVQKPPPRLRSVRAEIAPALDEAVAEALRMEVRERCPTAARFASRLVDAGAEVASPAEVAAYVTRAVGQRLQTRRARVAEVLALRAQMKRITVSASEEAEEANAPTGAAGAADAATSSPAAAVPASPALVSAALADEPLDEATTDSTSVSAPRDLVAAPRRAPGRIALAALGGIAIVLGVVAATSFSGGGGDAPGATANAVPGEEPGAAVASAAQAGAGSSDTAAPASREPSASDAPRPASEALPGAASALPSATSPAASGAAMPSARHTPPARSGGRRLAPSPYGRPR
jgi:eukaryotic-like serine/threonine-protein kinase